MHKLLLTVAAFVLSSALKKMIVGAGLGVTSMLFIQSLFQRYYDHVLHSAGSFQHNVVMFIGLSQLDQALSIIIGAVFARVAINAMTLAITKG